MPKCKLTWYKSEAKEILKEIKKIPQKDIAIEINESQQAVSYRLKNVYPECLEDLIRILKLAGFEIVKKDNIEGLEKILQFLKVAGFEIVKKGE